MSKIFIRVVYDKFKKYKVEKVIKEIKKIEKNFCFVSREYDKKANTNIIFTNDINELEKIVNNNKYTKIAIITECINSNFILECLKYTSCICYINANINIIVEKLKTNIKNR